MNIYLQRVKDLAIENKYTEWYLNVCSSALSRTNHNDPKYKQRLDAKANLTYTEGHHIFPKCICETQADKAAKTNCVFLSSREHFLCHWLLCKMFNGEIRNKMMAAMSFLVLDPTGDRKVTSRQFSTSRKMIAIACSERRPMTGKFHSNETKIKMSRSAKGITKSPSHKTNISLGKLGSVQLANIITKERKQLNYAAAQDLLSDPNWVKLWFRHPIPQTYSNECAMANS